MVVRACNPQPGRLRHGDYKFVATPGYIARPCLKTIAAATLPPALTKPKWILWFVSQPHRVKREAQESVLKQLRMWLQCSQSWKVALDSAIGWEEGRGELKFMYLHGTKPVTSECCPGHAPAQGFSGSLIFWITPGGVKMLILSHLGCVFQS
jgi:hypothetical protein